MPTKFFRRYAKFLADTNVISLLTADRGSAHQRMITFGLVCDRRAQGAVELRAVGTTPLFLHVAFENFRGGEGRGSKDRKNPPLRPRLTVLS
jgi:hypothetical protein